MLKNNQFLSVNDVVNPLMLAEKALELKKQPLDKKTGEGKSICLIFFNSSLRTRLSTQKAAFNLGMDVSVFNVGEDGWQLETEMGVVMDGGKAEHIKEAAAVIGMYYDIIGIRAFAELKNREKDYAESVIQSFVQYSGKPVVNLESASTHPLQSLTDLITILENKKVDKPKVVLSWAPHPRALPQAVPNSFAEWMLAVGFDLTIAHPEGYELSDKFTSGAKITHNQEEAFEGADIIYAKNWSSFTDYGQILSTGSEWQITVEKMNLTHKAAFMHCLPVRRNVIVADEVIDSENSVVIQQASNRVFAAQIVLKELLER